MLNGSFRIRISMWTVALLTAVATLMPLADATAAKKNAGPDLSSARPLTTEELYRLYHGRSWIWRDGAGYFQVSKRQFHAFSGRGRGIGYGEGLWFLTDGGRLCFRAEWNGRDGKSKALTCFAHYTDGKKIYQRKMPDGDWYVFRNSPQRRSDEASKLRPGDYAKHGVARAKARLKKN